MLHLGSTLNNFTDANNNNLAWKTKAIQAQILASSCGTPSCSPLKKYSRQHSSKSFVALPTPTLAL